MIDRTGWVNKYTCNTCGKSITTVDVDNGTTPFIIVSCFATSDCPGTMQSHGYRIETHGYNIESEEDARFEWYRPEKLPKKKYMAQRQHVELGGLLLRKVVK